MSWLDDLVNMHKELESPWEFWRWAGLATISAVVKDNVYLERAGSDSLTVYPNIYVMLHADSGLKKGPPINLAKSLVKAVNNTKIIGGRSSIQGILKELGTFQSQPGGRVIMKSTAFIAASEFSSSLVQDPAAMDILTDLFDRQYNTGDYASRLKMEQFELKDPTITLLVATNEAHFDNFIEAKDKRGGFLGRMFVIAESEVPHLNPLVDDLVNPPNKESLLPYLRQLSQLKGPFKKLKQTAAGELYKKWYIDFYTEVKKSQIKDQTGTIQRFGDTIIKVAMLLSLAEAPNLEISEEQMNEAIRICERLIGNIRKVTLGKQGIDTSNTIRKTILIQELMSREPPMISRVQLLKKYWMQGQDAEWDECARSLEQAEIITHYVQGNQIIFEMPRDVLIDMKRKLEGKNK